MFWPFFLSPDRGLRCAPDFHDSCRSFFIPLRSQAVEMPAAFHDTDSPGFPGVQRAVWELLHQSPAEYALHAHVDGLAVLQRL